MSKFTSWVLDIFNSLMVIFDPRVLIMLVPSLLYLYSVDVAQANTIVYTLAVMVVMAATSHWIRKIYFPYLDMFLLAELAKKDPLAAAIIFLSVSLIICTVLYSTVMWVRS